MKPPDERFTFLCRWLLGCCIFFTLQALGWVLSGSFDIFGVWDELMFRSLFNGETFGEVERFRRFILGPFGASVAAYFVLAFCLVHFVFPRQEAWAYWSLVGSFYTWFVTDSAASLAHGALFNVLLVNLPCALLMSFPLALLFPYFRPRKVPSL